MRILLSIISLLFLSSAAHAEQGRLTVLELFTSQGCSSCPPADDLLRELAEDESLLALSLHVDYWDYLGWKDPFSSAENTHRQRNYAPLIVDRGIYTPQLVVDGKFGVIGSQRSQVKSMIRAARNYPLHVPMQITPKQTTLTVSLTPPKDTESLPASATLYALHYARHNTTKVTRGENNGRKMTNINSVTSISTIGTWNKSAAQFNVPRPAADEGIAVLLHSDTQGRIIGAARYEEKL